MSEIEIAGAGVVFVGWAGRKLLGPLFDEMAEDWRSRYSERRLQNLNRIGRNAQAKLGDEIDSEGVVSPRVQLRLMEEGSWCEADVMTEYFGGILAASRSKDGADDRGAAWASLVGRLSTFDIYLHYLAYEAFRRTYVGRDLKLGIDQVRNNCEVYLPSDGVLEAMKLERSVENWTRFVSPSLSALGRENLVGDTYLLADPELIKQYRGIDVPESGIVITPSIPGLELFLWAHGHSRYQPDEFLRSDLVFDVQEDLGSVGGVRSVEVLRQERAERLQAQAAQAAREGAADDP